MFANFDLNQFPLVKVSFETSVKDENDFDDFLTQWLCVNSQQKPYSLFFDTTNIGIMNPKYAIRAGSFIKELKKQKPTYIQYSIIVVNHKYIRYLLDFVMSYQKPSAPVYIVDNVENGKNVLNKLLSYKDCDENKKVDLKNSLEALPEVSIIYPE